MCLGTGGNIENTTFHRNIASNSGGMVVAGGNFEICNSTVAKNKAKELGGGFVVFGNTFVSLLFGRFSFYLEIESISTLRDFPNLANFEKILIFRSKIF